MNVDDGAMDSSLQLRRPLKHAVDASERSQSAYLGMLEFRDSGFEVVPPRFGMGVVHDRDCLRENLWVVHGLPYTQVCVFGYL